MDTPRGVSIFFDMTKVPVVVCVAGFLVLTLAACSSAPVRDVENALLIPADYKANAQPTVVTPAARPLVPVTHAWWHVFADPTLNSLVERADRSNSTIQIAAARLSQARAQQRITNAPRALQAGLSASASRQGGPLLNAAGDSGPLVTTGVTLSYEVDLMGRLAQAGDAAGKDTESTALLMRHVRLLIQSQLVQTYLGLRALDAQSESLALGLANDQATLRVLEHRVQSGLAAEFELEKLRIELAGAQSNALELAQRRAELESTLAVLVGEASPHLQLARAPWTSAVPAIPVGVPASMLARRADVAAAEKSVQAAQARLGLAQSAWLPKLSLTSTGGFASPELATLLSGSMQAWAMGALVGLPLLDGGRLDAGVQYADGELAAAQAQRRERILQALKDVEDQLAAIRALAEQAAVQERAVTSASRLAQMSASRQRNGLASQLDVLEARRIELGQQRSLMQLQAQQQQAVVGLIRALGGGWS
jgi:outer membrane protein, multidrug efflux system